MSGLKLKKIEVTLHILNLLLSDSEEDSDDDLNLKSKIKKRQRKMWVRDFYKDRDVSGAFPNVVNVLALGDKDLFTNYMRMTCNQFEELLKIVGPFIKKQTYIREPIAPNQRLAITLRYLAGGESQKSLSFYYKCSPATVHDIVKEVTSQIWDCLKSKVFPTFTTDFFKQTANGFHRQWQFPHCIGALDGKHVIIEAPKKSGSTFFNYKKSHSIILMAVCDSQYRFLMCDIGAAGRQSDGGVFFHSDFGKKFNGNELPIPNDEDISDKFRRMPYVLVADDAFPLTKHMLKPFGKPNLRPSEVVFNYRLSRARRIIENTFGILSAKWRIFKQ